MRPSVTLVDHFVLFEGGNHKVVGSDGDVSDSQIGDLSTAIHPASTCISMPQNIECFFDSEKEYSCRDFSVE